MTTKAIFAEAREKLRALKPEFETHSGSAAQVEKTVEKELAKGKARKPRQPAEPLTDAEVEALMAETGQDN